MIEPERLRAIAIRQKENDNTIVIKHLDDRAVTAVICTYSTEIRMQGRKSFWKVRG
jgi:hypothetical protein